MRESYASRWLLGFYTGLFGQFYEQFRFICFFIVFICWIQIFKYGQRFSVEKKSQTYQSIIKNTLISKIKPITSNKNIIQTIFPTLLPIPKYTNPKSIIKLLIYNPIMQSTHLTHQKLTPFLRQLGYHFQTQRAMLQFIRQGKNILKVITQIFKELEPSFLRAILLTQYHHLSDDTLKQESRTIISDFIAAREVLKATNFDFKLSDYIQKVLPVGRDFAILSHLYSVRNWSKHIANINDVRLGRLKTLQREERAFSQNLKEVNIELVEVERLKQMEKPNYQEKILQMAVVKEDVSRLRAKKSQLVPLKINRDKELMGKMRDIDQCLYRIESLEIEIGKAKKELSINAPQIRKQKLRQDAALGEALARQMKLVNYLNALNAHLANRMEQLEGNISKLRGLNFLQPLQQRSYALKQQAKRLKYEEEQKKNSVHRLQEELASHRQELGHQQRKQEKQNELLASLRVKRIQLQNLLEKKKIDLTKLNESISSLRNMHRGTQKQLQQLQKQNHQESLKVDAQMRSIQKDALQWNSLVSRSLSQAHQSFQLNLFSSK